MLLKDLADIYNNLKQLDKAIPLYEKLLGLNPEDTALIRHLADIYNNLKEFEKAAALYEKLLELDPDNTALIRHLADIYNNLKQLDKAIPLYEKLLGLNPEDTALIRHLADIYNNLKEFEKAAALYEKLLELDPDNTALIRHLADIYNNLKDYDKVIPLYEKLLKSDPDNTQIIQRLLGNYHDLNDYDKTIPLYEKLIKQDPGNTALLKQFADICSKVNKPGKAALLYEKLLLEGDLRNPQLVKDAFYAHKRAGAEGDTQGLYNKLSELVKNDTDYLCFLGEILRELDEFSLSLAAYERMLETSPKNVNIMEAMVSLYRRLKGDDATAEFCEKIVKLNNRSMVALECLSSVYNSRGEYAKAAVYYEKILEIKPKDLMALSCLVNAYMITKQFNRLQEIEQRLRKAVTLNPPHAFSLEALGELCKQTNRDDEAADFFLACKEADPYYKNAYIGLGQVYLKQRKFENAINVFEEGLKMVGEVERLKKELDWAVAEKKRYEIASITSGKGRSLSQEEMIKIAKPRFCAVGIVRRCNFRCKMCNIWENKLEKELSVEQWKQFLVSFRNIADNHCQINFAGGEPFLKEGLTDIIKLARELGFATAVCTNAYLIDEETARKIGESGLRTIALSLDSLVEEKHDFLRGVKGSYVRVMRAIELLRKFAPKTELNLLTILLEANINDAVALAEWTQKNDSINMINFLGLVQPRGNEKESAWYANQEYKLIWPQDPGLLCSTVDKLIEMKKNGYNKIGNPVSQLANFKNYYTKPKDYIRKRIACNMGYLFLSINEKGDVTLCEERGPIGNVLEQDIKDIWFSEMAKKERDAIGHCNKNCHQVINCCYEEEV